MCIHKFLQNKMALMQNILNMQDSTIQLYLGDVTHIGEYSLKPSERIMFNNIRPNAGCLVTSGIKLCKIAILINKAMLTYSKTAVVAVMAHEMGHAYYKHADSDWLNEFAKEKQADAICGYLLYHLGHHYTDVWSGITGTSTDFNSNEYPVAELRRRFVKAGWELAKMGVKL